MLSTLLRVCTCFPFQSPAKSFEDSISLAQFIDEGSIAEIRKFIQGHTAYQYSSIFFLIDIQIQMNISMQI